MKDKPRTEKILIKHMSGKGLASRLSKLIWLEIWKHKLGYHFWFFKSTKINHEILSISECEAMGNHVYSKLSMSTSPRDTT